MIINNRVNYETKETNGILSGLSLRARGQGFPIGYFENDPNARSIGKA